jgi:hypothetical protein
MTTYVHCWQCLRAVPREEALFVVLEDDGCGEWECADVAGCVRATPQDFGPPSLSHMQTNAIPGRAGGGRRC